MNNILILTFYIQVYLFKIFKQVYKLKKNYQYSYKVKI